MVLINPVLPFQLNHWKVLMTNITLFEFILYFEAWTTSEMV